MGRTSLANYCTSAKYYLHIQITCGGVFSGYAYNITNYFHLLNDSTRVAVSNV